METSSAIMDNSPFAVIGTVIQTIFEAFATFFTDYIFGVLALIFIIRLIVSLFNGRLNILLVVLTAASFAIAIPLGQLFWLDWLF